MVIVVVLVVAVAAALASALITRTIMELRQGPELARLGAARAHAEAALDEERGRRAFELELSRALEHATTEREVLDIVRAALLRIDPARPIELHLVDPEEPVLRLAVTTDLVVDTSGVTASPWDSLAARTGKTLVYESTEQLDTCPHLRSRVTEPCSAVCVPLNAMGRIVGVLYATGPVGVPPTQAATDSLELVARTTAAHVATVRAFAREEHVEGDPLTGLPDRRTALGLLRRKLAHRETFAIALCDIDHFRLYNARHTAVVGDAALRLLAETLCRTLRPTDVVSRLDGEQFLVLLDGVRSTGAVKAVERVREMLVITQATRPEPAFTVSFGVADSTQTDSVEGLLCCAGDALDAAKRAGRNRVIAADIA
ncbi:MAG TPA: sensor domain-containing diguanylate cyclase [Acidimicrobiales bacterium]